MPDTVKLTDFEAKLAEWCETATPEELHFLVSLVDLDRCQNLLVWAVNNCSFDIATAARLFEISCPNMILGFDTMDELMESGNQLEFRAALIGGLVDSYFTGRYGFYGLDSGFYDGETRFLDSKKWQGWLDENDGKCPITVPPAFLQRHRGRLVSDKTLTYERLWLLYDILRELGTGVPERAAQAARSVV
jgi:hypothetical protein